MGLMSQLLGRSGVIPWLGTAAKGMAEVLAPSTTHQMERSAEGLIAALKEGHEGPPPAFGVFDRVVNGLNRLPRPFLAFGTIGLFLYAMRDPQGFALRMGGLNAVPEPLWWLLGVVVAFYFGARETFHFRNRQTCTAPVLGAVPPLAHENPALREWQAKARGSGSDS